MINIAIQSVSHIEPRHSSIVAEDTEISVGRDEIVLEQLLGYCGGVGMLGALLVVLELFKKKRMT